MLEFGQQKLARFAFLIKLDRGLKSVHCSIAPQTPTTAHAERFGASEMAGWIKLEHLLAPRRQADTNNDLFSVMNRIQENVIRGGVKAWGRNRLNRSSRRITTREVKGIDQTVSLNRALWNAAESLMQFKSA